MHTVELGVRAKCPARVFQDCGAGFTLGWCFGLLYRLNTLRWRPAQMERFRNLYNVGVYGFDPKIRFAPLEGQMGLTRHHWKSTDLIRTSTFHIWRRYFLRHTFRPARKFGRWTFFFSLYDCAITYVRGVSDIISPIIAGGLVMMSRPKYIWGKSTRLWLRGPKRHYQYYGMFRLGSTRLHNRYRWSRYWKPKRITSGLLFLAAIEGFTYFIMEMMKNPEDTVFFLDPFFEYGNNTEQQEDEMRSDFGIEQIKPRHYSYIRGH